MISMVIQGLHMFSVRISARVHIIRKAFLCFSHSVRAKAVQYVGTDHERPVSDPCLIDMYDYFSFSYKFLACLTMLFNVRRLFSLIIPMQGIINIFQINWNSEQFCSQNLKNRVCLLFRIAAKADLSFWKEYLYLRKTKQPTTMAAQSRATITLGPRVRIRSRHWCLFAIFCAVFYYAGEARFTDGPLHRPQSHRMSEGLNVSELILDLNSPEGLIRVMKNNKDK
jgi:hypothetical protein